MKEGRVEIVVVGLVAAFLAWLWFANRARGGGTGLASLPAWLGGSGGAPPVTVAGDSFPALPGFPAINSTGPTFNSSPFGGGGCGCASCTEPGGSIAFGTPDQLVQYLSGLDMSALANATKPGGSY